MTQLHDKPTRMCKNNKQEKELLKYNYMIMTTLPITSVSVRRKSEIETTYIYHDHNFRWTVVNEWIGGMCFVGHNIVSACAYYDRNIAF